jgi:Protein of unknown function (DUF3617)
MFCCGHPPLWEIIMRLLAIACCFATGLLLSACGSDTGVDARNESPEAVAAKVAASGMTPKPGRWQASLKMESMDMPGMPAGVREQMNKSMGTTQTYFTCLTKEQAAKPDASFFQKSAPGCTYNRFTMSGGKIDALMTCPPGRGPTQMAMTGTYGEELYDIKIKGGGEMAKGMTMNIAMAVTSRRVGECDGTEQQ